MERAEIIKELKALHDAMVFGTSIIPGRQLIQAVFEAAELIDVDDERDVIAKV